MTEKDVIEITEDILYDTSTDVSEKSTFLQENSLKLKKNTISMEKEVIESFAKISNPGTRVFLEKMDEMIRIYNHTTEICFDEKQIYLVTD